MAPRESGRMRAFHPTVFPGPRLARRETREVDNPESASVISTDAWGDPRRRACIFTASGPQAFGRGLRVRPVFETRSKRATLEDRTKA